VKILTVLGARPQFIKAAAVSRAIRQFNETVHSEKVREVIVHTGQHFDANMSDVFFHELDIPKPNYNLGIASLGHGAMTGRMLEGIESLIQKELPNWVLVYGDTNSTLAGALAAAGSLPLNGAGSTSGHSGSSSQNCIDHQVCWHDIPHVERL
jgi:UDP-GlcNAc3NAcA epimerase